MSLQASIGRESSGTERPVGWIGERVAPRSDTTENLTGRGFVDRTAHKQFAAVFEPHLVEAYRLARKGGSPSVDGMWRRIIKRT